MITTREKAAVGAFLIAVALLIAASLAALWGVNATKPTKKYFILFDESVSGLLPGSQVKYLGLDVGKVEGMRIDEGPPVRIRVEVAIDLKTPVRVDTKAKLVGQGITGIRFLELTRGFEAQERDPATSIPELPSDWVDMIDRFTKISAAVEKLLNDENRAEVTRVLRNTNAFLEQGTATIVSGQAAVASIAGRVEKILDEQREPFQDIVRSTRSTLAKLDKLIDEKKIGGAIDDLAGAARDARRAVESLETTARDFRDKLAQTNVAAAVADVRSAAATASAAIGDARRLTPRIEDDLERTGRLLDDLRRTSRTLDDLARELRERPSLLIRDFERSRREVPDK